MASRIAAIGFLFLLSGCEDPTCHPSIRALDSIGGVYCASNAHVSIETVDGKKYVVCQCGAPADLGAK